MNTDETHYGIEDLMEVELRDDETFLQVIETLTRIGIANFKTKTLFQSCHLLQKRGKYYIVHFKELFALDGNCTRDHFNDTDHQRRNRIAKLLSDWGLIRVKEPFDVVEGEQRVKVFVLKHAEAKETDENGDPIWTLVAKYTIGDVHE